MAATQRIVLSALCLLLGLGRCFSAEAPPPVSRAATPSVAPTGARVSATSETTRRQFRQLCAACHGTDYTGNPWREKGHDIPDFTDNLWHSCRTDAKLAVSILEGKGTRMPAFAQRLSEPEVRALVSLIRQANATPPENAGSGPSDFESRFAELSKEMEALKKQFHELDKKSLKPQPSSP